MVFKRLREDIDAIMHRDPAARSRLEVLLCYPGLHAVLIHRLASALWRRGWLTTGRFVSYLAKIVTGVEIHPGATIGRRLFIDHATMVGIPARIASRSLRKEDGEFCSYGIPEGVPDPIAGTLNGLMDDVRRLNARIAELEGRLDETGSGVGDPPAERRGPALVEDRLKDGARVNG